MLRFVAVAALCFMFSACQPSNTAPAEAPADSAAVSAAETAVAAGPTPSAQGALSYIISPSDGEVVTSPVTIRFGLKGMGVAPATVQMPDTGHHHLMVDVEVLPDLTFPIPADGNHIHFGQGQTETELELEPGTHTLQLVLADFKHTPHVPAVVSPKITITVR